MHGTWQPFGAPGRATLPIVRHAQTTWHQHSMGCGTDYNWISTLIKHAFIESDYRMCLLKANDWGVVLNFDRNIETFPFSQFLKNLETFVCYKVVPERFHFQVSVTLLKSFCLSVWLSVLICTNFTFTENLPLAWHRQNPKLDKIK